MALLRVLTILLVVLAAPAAATGLELRGQVVSSEGPVARASVTLTPMASNYGLGAQFLDLQPPSAPVSVTETGDDGRFAIAAPNVGFWGLRVDAAGFAPFERLLLQIVEDTELGELQLEPAEALEILVTDQERHPLPARLSIFRTSSSLRGEDFKSLGRRWRVSSTTVPGSPWRWLPTDAQGRWVLDVASEDRLLVRAVAPGFVAGEVLHHGGGSVRLALRRGLERELLVVGGGDRALPGVLVFDERAEMPLTATDDDGRTVVTWEGDRPLRAMLLDADGRRGAARIDPPRPDSTPVDEVVTITLDEPMSSV